MNDDGITGNDVIIGLIFNIAYFYPKFRLKVKQEKGVLILIVLDHYGHLVQIYIEKQQSEDTNLEKEIIKTISQLEENFERYINLEELK